MTAFPAFDIDDLAQFSGRPDSSYPDPYSDQALMQAALLFRLATGLDATGWPDTADMSELASLAILSLADSFILNQPYQASISTPFQSETIGSYSYSLKQVRTLVMAGQPTGIPWFDMAVQFLGVSGYLPHVTSSTIEVFYDELPVYNTSDGNKRVRGPSEIVPIDTPYSISRNIPYDPNRSARGRGSRG